MKNCVNFKDVVSEARFDILGGFKCMLPVDFDNLSDTEKKDYYRTIFDLHHDLCSFLSAYLQLDDINSKYRNK